MITRIASRTRLLAGAAFAAVVLTGCAGSPAAGPAPAGQATAPATSSVAASPSSTPSMAASPSGDSMSPAAALQLSMAQTDLGSILVDGRGMTLYLFTKDSPNTSVCEGQCLVNWPPLLGEPTAGEGVDDSKLGSFQRADGRTQATYNGWPLYYWINDAAPGDTTGQNVQGVWFVLDRDGDAIR